MKKVLIIASIVVALIVGGALLLPRLAWDGAAPMRINFQVMDQGSSRPIRDARIWVVTSAEDRHFGETNITETFRPLITDEKGRATISLVCPAGGGTFMVWKTGRLVISHQLMLEAPGYAPVTTPLANVLGTNRWPVRKRQHDRKLWMVRNDRAG